MIQSLVSSTTIPLLHELAKFSERRQDVLAGNIANISTPDFKARDLPVAEFQQALRDAVAGRIDASSPEGASWKFQTPVSSQAGATRFDEKLFQAAEAAPQGVTFHDGNNRSVESQMMEMTKNSLLYDAAVELMKVQFNRLQAIVSERP